MIHWERCQTCQKLLETEQEQESGICGRCAIKPKYYDIWSNMPLACSGVSYTSFNIETKLGPIVINDELEPIPDECMDAIYKGLGISKSAIRGH